MSEQEPAGLFDRPEASTEAIMLVPIEQLKPHPENPRRGNVSAIREAIRLNGWHGTLVAQKSTNYVLVGNHRLEAGVLEGFTALPVHYVDVDDATARRILLSDNRTADLATYDDPLLLKLLEADAAENPSLEGTGFSQPEFERLRLGLQGGEALEWGSQGQGKAEIWERWQESQIRQIVLILNEEEFVKVGTVLRDVIKERGLKDNTEAVLYLVDQYLGNRTGLRESVEEPRRVEA